MKKREKVFCFLAIIAVLGFFIQLLVLDKPPDGIAYLSKVEKLISKAAKCRSQEKYSLAIGYFNQALELIDKAELSLLMETTSSGEKTKLQEELAQIRDTTNKFKKHTEKIWYKSIDL
ncbi:hypothetical protein KJ761_00995 [Patescibacteria group bacterium]|nr:hypothetical protein [Patescibacteria group bacterium]